MVGGSCDGINRRESGNYLSIEKTNKLNWWRYGVEMWLFVIYNDIVKILGHRRCVMIGEERCQTLLRHYINNIYSVDEPIEFDTLPLVIEDKNSEKLKTEN